MANVYLGVQAGIRLSDANLTSVVCDFSLSTITAVKLVSTGGTTAVITTANVKAIMDDLLIDLGTAASAVAGKYGTWFANFDDTGKLISLEVVNFRAVAAPVTSGASVRVPFYPIVTIGAIDYIGMNFAKYYGYMPIDTF